MILSINYEIKNNTNNYLNHFKQQQLLNIEEVLSIDNMFDTTAKLIKCKVCLFVVVELKLKKIKFFLYIYKFYFY